MKPIGNTILITGGAFDVCRGLAEGSHAFGLRDASHFVWGDIR